MSSASFALTLEEGFASPPHAAKPHVWYHLMNGNVTKAGITRDFEALAAAGIGGVQMFDAGCGIEAGPLAFASADWFDMMAHSFREAERLGLEVVVANCSGWSTAGGPWIAPSNSMKRLTFVATDVLEGPRHATVRIPEPADTCGFYADIATIAVPEPDALPPLPQAAISRTERKVSMEFPSEVMARGFSYKVEYPWCWSVDGILSTPRGEMSVTLARSGVCD